MHTETTCSMRLILFLFFSLVCLTGKTQTGKVKTSSAPAWVVSRPIDYTFEKGIAEAEGGYLDLSYEKQVFLAKQTAFTRKALKILTEPGLENASEISVNFDPSFQQLVFHSIRILRGQQSLDRLNLSRIKVIQQESDLDKHLYDGTLTAYLTLEDVQVNDIIEYSYSVQGFNPLFSKFSTYHDVQYTVPIGNLYYRLLVPANRTITLRNYLTDLKPVISQAGAEKVYEWSQKEVAPLRVPEGLPQWQDPYPSVFISEYANWGEVVNWALPLYPINQTPSPRITEKLATLKSSYAAPEDQVLAAIRFVQDEIRYMGEETGVNSHQPHQPDKILLQRFGDCKDKSYLLCVLLRSLGAEAYPVLINTMQKKGIHNWLPTPFAFNHVTVQLIWKGKTYWIDPTISMQRGKLDDISYPDYQVGLVIKPGVQGLTSIALQDKGQTRIKETIDLLNMSGKAYLTVVTTNTGSYADAARSSFKNNSFYEIQKKYKAFYASYYKEIVADSLRYTDDPLSGNFVIKEFYSIPQIWEYEGLKRSLNLSPFVLNSSFVKPKEKEATTYAQTYPTRYFEEVEVNLPEEWDGELMGNKEVKNENFRYSSQFSGDQQRYIFRYEYETLKDHIAAEERAQYHEDYEAASNNGYEFYVNEGGKASLSDLPLKQSSATTYDNILTLCYVVLAGFVVATILVRHNRRNA